MTEHATGSRLSIHPDKFSHGGGLLNDVDVTIKTARWRSWDYMGKSDKKVIACNVSYELEDGTVQEQYYSAGDAESFVASKDEKTLQQVGKRDTLSDSSNFYQFIVSVFHAGYPADLLLDGRDETDVSWLDGLKVHVIQEAQPERKGLSQEPKQGGRERTTLCVSKIYNLPKGAKAATKGAAAKSTAAASKTNGTEGVAAAEVLGDAATEAILSVLGDNNGSVTKQKLSQLMFSHLKGNPQRNDIITLAFNQQFLESNPMIRFDGATISLPA